MWLLRWKKPSELTVKTETALPPVPTSHGGIERKVVAEGLQGGEAHHVSVSVVMSKVLRAHLGAPNGLYDRAFTWYPVGTVRPLVPPLICHNNYGSNLSRSKK